MLQIDEKLCSSLNTEIRKLKPTELCTIATLLNINDEWKRLTSVITKENDSSTYKFNADHVFMIEQASKMQHRNCAEIFLDEWGTMGKKRPTVDILLNLLIKAELYRVADYIKGEIKRPNDGPAARVDELIFTDSDNEYEDRPEDDYKKNLLQIGISNNFAKKTNINTINPQEFNQHEKSTNPKKANKLNVFKLNDSTDEQVDFGNKTTKRFDDIESKPCAKSLNLIEFSKNYKSIKTTEKKSIELKKEPAEYELSTPQNQSLCDNPGIPVFLQSSIFSEGFIEAVSSDVQNEGVNVNTNQSSTQIHCSQLTNNFTDLNISSCNELHSDKDNKKQNQSEELNQPLNIPAFLLSSNFL